MQIHQLLPEPHPHPPNTDIDRELLVLKREEQKLIREIKAAASKGNQAGAKTLAKQLIRIRNQMQRLTVHNAQMKGVSAQITVCMRC